MGSLATANKVTLVTSSFKLFWTSVTYLSIQFILLQFSTIFIMGGYYYLLSGGYHFIHICRVYVSFKFRNNKNTLK